MLRKFRVWLRGRRNTADTRQHDQPGVAEESSRPGVCEIEEEKEEEEQQLLPENEPTSGPESIPMSSTFAAPAQQSVVASREPLKAGFGSFTAPETGPQALGSLPNSGHVHLDRNLRSSSFTAGYPNPDMMLYRYPSAQHAPGISVAGVVPRYAPWTPAPNMVPLQRHSIGHLPVEFVMRGGQRSSRRIANYASILNIASFMLLIVSAPLGIWFSYYLWTASTVLLAGPVAAALALCAVFFTKWGVCGIGRPKLKCFKLVITIAAIFDIGGAVIIPLVLFGANCSTADFPACPFDKPHGKALSIAIACVMVIHGILCIVARFRALTLVNEHLGGLELDSFVLPSSNSSIHQGLLHDSRYIRAPLLTNRSRSFTSVYPGSMPQAARLYSFTG